MTEWSVLAKAVQGQRKPAPRIVSAGFLFNLLCFDIYLRLLHIPFSCRLNGSILNKKILCYFYVHVFH